MPIDEENEDTSDQKLEEAEGEIMEETREEELLVLQEVLRPQTEEQDEPPTFFPHSTHTQHTQTKHLSIHNLFPHSTHSQNTDTKFLSFHSRGKTY